MKKRTRFILIIWFARASSNQQPKTENTKPSLPLKRYLGGYNDKMYGDINLSQKDNGDLEISFSHTPLFKGKLTHWHYDTFKIDWYDMRVPDGYLTFNFNKAHEVIGMTIEQESLLDVDFAELEILKKKD